MTSLFSKATIATIGLVCKTFLNIGYCSSVSVNGLENLLQVLSSDERNSGRGVVTISNHISTLDDPVTWGVLPARCFVDTRMTRWTLGASDIMFTNPIFSVFFRNGQVIETVRGGGIFQPAVDTAIQKLNTGAWIHLFGEGKVNQPTSDPDTKSANQLLRFKWGVGRIIMEAAKPPVIVPMWLTGFDKLMPEGRPAPFHFFPRRGVALSVTFGKPICVDKLTTTLSSVIPGDAPHLSKDARVTSSVQDGESVLQREQHVRDNAAESEAATVRKAVTALLQRNVQALGERVMEHHTTRGI